jgi:uncharacterized protein YecT (DUF1311 family)
MTSARIAGLAAFGMLLAGCVSAHAQELDCSNALAQQDMNRCAWLHFEQADKALNAVYARAIAQTKQLDRDLDTGTDRPIGAEDALRRAQRAWITYRDAHCEAMASHSRGGSMEPMLISGCQAYLTEDRTKELEDLVSELGG